MDIGEVVRLSGVPASTLRFYEERGLIRSVGRHGLRRLFHESVMEQLALIALGRTAGFSLDDIARMLATNGPNKIDRKMLIEKSDELEKTIKKLTAMRDGLRHAAHCSAPSHLECPKFRRLMGLAVTSAKHARGKKALPKKVPPKKTPPKKRTSVRR